MTQSQTQQPIYYPGVELSEFDGMDADAQVQAQCGRCSGDGVVHYGRNAFRGTVRGVRTEDRICFKCNGSGGRWITVSVARRRAKQYMARQAKAEVKRAEAAMMARIEAEREAADLDQRRAAFRIEYGVECAFLDTLNGEFAESLREKLETFGSLTQGQLDALNRMIADRSSEPEAAPVVEGRIQITGTVKSTKYVDNAYGTSHKMLVMDDRGFKVWGTVPQSVEPLNYYNENRELVHEHGVGCGGRDSNHRLDAPIRVTFTATVEQSRDDETFGFFKRPTKAEVL